MEHLKESAQKVQMKLMELGYTHQVVELPDSTRTAQEAADAIGQASSCSRKWNQPSE
ncbi:hypothetical protein [Brevibacillus sp. NRS-1366]|uniref:hypothetical protein n=1 Tax=Brevibacillus sp. NRS-1366 TaxID=3233899 RepID=UPI003D1DCB15